LFDKNLTIALNSTGIRLLNYQLCIISMKIQLKGNIILLILPLSFLVYINHENDNSLDKFYFRDIVLRKLKRDENLYRVQYN